MRCLSRLKKGNFQPPKGYNKGIQLKITPWYEKRRIETKMAKSGHSNKNGRSDCTRPITSQAKECRRRTRKKTEQETKRRPLISQLTEEMESIETYCEWAGQNLENLDIEQKRLVFEAIDIHVVVDGKLVMIRGLLPIGEPASFPGFYTPKCAKSREKQPAIAFELTAALA